jgi:hypothetical protein
MTSAQRIPPAPSLFKYAIRAWTLPTPPENERSYSMHRRASHGTIIAVFLFLIFLDSAITHIFVAERSELLAWSINASSLWLALYLVADAHAARLRPLELEDDGLVFSVGMRWRGFVPYAILRSVSTSRVHYRDQQTLRATVVSAGDLSIELTEPLEAHGPFGLKKRATCLVLTVDRPAELAAALQHEIRARAHVS